MSSSKSEILIDPEISKKKFNEEIKQFLKIQDDLRKRGWILEKHEYPLARVTFINRHIHPRIAVCTVDIDFRNFDVLPPSLDFRDPFSLLPCVDVMGLKQQISNAERSGIQLQPNNMRSLVRGTYVKDKKMMEIILTHPETGKVFMCMPGVREYHSHPAHTNDPWHNHRKRMSSGILNFLLSQIDSCCVEPMRALPLNFPLSIFPIEHYYLSQ